MKIEVMGAGAVSCYYGGMLAGAGNDVTLIGRNATHSSQEFHQCSNGHR
jgi:ketopantoate reductase